MAETNIVGGLFGMTPEALQAQQFQQQQDQALLMAKMSPFERANYGMAMAGSQLGSAIPKMFGYQDPQMVKASTIQQLSQEANLDLSNPDSFKTLSSKLAKAGYLNEANMAAQKAREIEAATSKIVKESAEAQKILTEVPFVGMTEAMKNAKGLGLEQGTIAYKDYVESVTGKIPQNIGVARGTDKAVYSSVEGQFVYEKDPNTGALIKVAYTGPVDRKTAETRITNDIGAAFTKAFNAKDAADKAAAWDTAGKAYAQAPSIVGKLNEVKSVLNNAYTGAGADKKMALSKALGALNIPISSKASDTEYVDALTKLVALPLVKQYFSGSTAVRELETVLATKPSVIQEPQTILRLVDNIISDINASSYAYKKGEEYKAQNKGDISGFNPYTYEAEARTEMNRMKELERKAKGGK